MTGHTSSCEWVRLIDSNGLIQCRGYRQPGLFPAFAMKLLDFVALYGFILAPFGAIIVFEHFFHKQAGIVQNFAELADINFNKAVFWAWVISFGLFYGISLQFYVFLSFVTLPAWLLCGVLFLVFNKILQKNNSNKSD